MHEQRDFMLLTVISQPHFRDLLHSDEYPQKSFVMGTREAPTPANDGLPIEYRVDDRVPPLGR